MILIIRKVHCINTNLFKEFKEFHQSLGVDNRSTTAYHPESNGLFEAHNKISSGMLNVSTTMSFYYCISICVTDSHCLK